MRAIWRGIAAAAAWTAVIPAGGAATQVRVIRSDADLPATRYTLPALPSTIYMSDRFRDEVMPAARRDGEALLTDYRIEDPALAISLRSSLASIALLDGRYDTARRLIAEALALQPKP